MHKDRHPARKFSLLSEANSLIQPGRKMACSLNANWGSLLLQTFETSGSGEAFETLATPDQQIVLMLKGEYDIESFSSRSWKRAAYRPGLGGMTAALNTNRLRWQSHQCPTAQTLHLYVPHCYFLEAMEEFRQAGASQTQELPDTLAFEDPVVFSVAKSLADGVGLGLPDLYADAGARFLATHLIAKLNGWSDRTLNRNIGNGLSDRRLMRVIEFMRHHFMDPITLDHLAREAGISRFHFARLFKKKLGFTPHHHLVQLRMKHAKFLLATTDLAVLEIATACGYVHLGHFAAAFQRSFCMTPSAYRRVNVK